MIPTSLQTLRNAVQTCVSCILITLLSTSCVAQKHDDTLDRLPDLVPEADGVYRTQPGLRPAIILKAAEAAFPEREPAVEDGCALVLVVGVDGKASRIEVLYSPGKAFEDPAIAAVEQSEFQPAFKPSLSHDHPVPSWVDVWVPFHADKRAAAVQLTSKLHPDTYPKVLHSVAAEYSEVARRKKINGTVLLTLLVDPKGRPADIHVVRGIGYGLDEKAIAAASQYRFKPATIDGVSVPQRISIQVTFNVD